ncbi:hypothetical protein [Methanobrevibacter thaueri]|uniref:Right handed beta helix domain-containing protein n=1 Tax=Methanobrevibacter thaueri TaxID=190975 RepID=A0A315XPD5_9EURY|nr:hypothetical protein [Methanobrevibacter thaueri]PWB88000.1 hypothetical protein MBBTH_05870 [Methanobrevibacter thaueri]
MGKVNKLLIISMLVMLVCCVSAVSATDIDSVNDVSDDIAIDEVTDVVDDVAIDDTVEEVADEVIDDSADNYVDEGNLRQSTNSVIITDGNYSACFDTSTGYMFTNHDLTFVGNFSNKTFGNFKINSNIEIDATNAIFNNIGFDFVTSNIVFKGGTFITNPNVTTGSVLTVSSSHINVSDVTINVTAPENKDFYAMALLNANYAEITNNTIYYLDTFANPSNYNYAVKVKGGSKNNMVGNTIIVSVPLKDVNYTDYETKFPTIDFDMVAGVAVESCDSFNFANNNLNATANLRTGDYPTLSALIIVKSDNSNVTGNKIYVRDNVSSVEEANFLYAVDIYRCNNVLIDNNNIDLKSKSGNLTVNGTGAAYGIQLTGPHTGVMISNNNITTINNGPNLGIYSQNSQGQTSITVKNNKINVTGRAGFNNWALVSGMELQDSYATVTGNTIDVTNVAGPYNGYYIFGISYCQPTSGDHKFNITNNTVRAPHSPFAVYLNNVTNSNVSYNVLTAKQSHGNNAVYMTGTGNNKGNNS